MYPIAAATSIVSPAIAAMWRRDDAGVVAGTFVLGSGGCGIAKAAPAEAARRSRARSLALA
jgi:hypothetical protein